MKLWWKFRFGNWISCSVHTIPFSTKDRLPKAAWIKHECIILVCRVFARQLSFSLYIWFILFLVNLVERHCSWIKSFRPSVAQLKRTVILCIDAIIHLEPFTTRCIWVQLFLLTFFPLFLWLVCIYACSSWARCWWFPDCHLSVLLSSSDCSFPYFYFTRFWTTLCRSIDAIPDNQKYKQLQRELSQVLTQRQIYIQPDN